jgi:hypothetical protein
MISSMFSMLIERRTRPGVMPQATWVSALRWEWVVFAG